MRGHDTDAARDQDLSLDGPSNSRGKNSTLLWGQGSDSGQPTLQEANWGWRMENNGNSVGSSGNSCRVIKRSLSVRRLLPRKAQAPGREPPAPTRSPRDHVLGSKLVQPLEQLVLHLQILYDGLHHQVCAVDHGRCIRAGRYAAQGLRHKLVSTLMPWRKEKRVVTRLTGKRLMRCKGGRKQEGEDRPEHPRQLNVL